MAFVRCAIRILGSGISFVSSLGAFVRGVTPGDRRVDVLPGRVDALLGRVDAPPRRADLIRRRTHSFGQPVHAIAECDTCVDGSRDPCDRHVISFRRPADLSGRLGEAFRRFDTDSRRRAGSLGPDDSNTLTVARVVRTCVMGVRSRENFHASGA